MTHNVELVSVDSQKNSSWKEYLWNDTRIQGGNTVYGNKEKSSNGSGTIQNKLSQSRSRDGKTPPQTSNSS